MNNIYVDFNVSSSLNYLSVTDYSNWLHIENKPAIIEITLPGYSSKITKYFGKNKVNVFNSIDLELNCLGGCDDPNRLPLPDGIYTIKVKGSPSTFNKEYKYLKRDSFDLEMDKVFIEVYKKTYKREFMEKLDEVEFMMRSAEAHLKFDNVELAGSLFTKATELLETLKNTNVQRLWK